MVQRMGLIMAEYFKYYGRIPKIVDESFGNCHRYLQTESDIEQLNVNVSFYTHINIDMKLLGTLGW